LGVQKYKKRGENIRINFQNKKKRRGGKKGGQKGNQDCKMIRSNHRTIMSNDGEKNDRNVKKEKYE